jgi:hypothetical protein
MSYTLYTDKNENFSADVSVKNASLKNSIARLIVESEGLNLVFKGTIEGDKCIIPIKKLKGIMEENTTGKMHLEIIVEDVYFKPWESDFIVEEHTSMKVVVQEQKKEDKKPLVEVVVAKGPAQTIEKTDLSKETKPLKEKHVVKISNQKQSPSDELVSICERVGITKKTLTKEVLKELLGEYFKVNGELIGKREAISRQFLKKIK